MDRTEPLFRRLLQAVDEWTRARGTPWADYDWRLKVIFDELNDEWRAIVGNATELSKVTSLEQRVAKLERELALAMSTRVHFAQRSEPLSIKEEDEPPCSRQDKERHGW